ncbi:hypothetical protein JGK52_06615 [Cytobacillus oceanisediminis]|uniref:hypothetical protein n=1 Tax=Cytobacillus oceanisediminis TaxID=665099 RepID=UPI001D139B66|nr:hypothetical protein [Cytobacillus oceanisediminis]MCC3646358.1 hypothetical protein [Cytobacillus oceanisediminis]
MPFTPLDRIVSLGNDGVFTSTVDAASARNNLRDNNASSIAVQVSNPYPFWPRLDNFLNDNNPNPNFSGAAQPQFIWNKPQAFPDETVFFAVGSSLFGIAGQATADFSVYLTSFADNAHQVEEIRLFQVDGTTPPFSYTPVHDLVNASPPAFTTAPLADGPLMQPKEVDPPFLWQNVRYYSNSFSYMNPNNSSRTYQIIVVFRAKNYLNPPNLIRNPGGLAFHVDIYSQNASLAATP